MGKVQKIGVLGSGNVGQTLANGLVALGYDVQIGRRTNKPLENWLGSVNTYKNVAKSADVVVLSVLGSAAEDVVSQIKPFIDNKLVIDTTNPIANVPPDNGVLSYFSSLDNSLMERLQKIAPLAHFVKAFNSCGASLMVNPPFTKPKPSMFICGNSSAAKKVATKLISAFGWDVEDMGGEEAARAIEPLCMLWCIPGLQQNHWNHAFKLLKSN